MTNEQLVEQLLKLDPKLEVGVTDMFGDLVPVEGASIYGARSAVPFIELDINVSAAAWDPNEGT